MQSICGCGSLFMGPCPAAAAAGQDVFRVSGYHCEEPTAAPDNYKSIPDRLHKYRARCDSVASVDTFMAQKPKEIFAPGPSVDDAYDDDNHDVAPEFDELRASPPGSFVGDGYPRPAPSVNHAYLKKMEELGHRRVLFSAPNVTEATAALVDLRILLRGEKRGPNSKGYKPVDFDKYVRDRLEGMRTMLALYTSPNCTHTYEKWSKAARETSEILGGGAGCARRIAELARAFIEDRQVRPINPYGAWTSSRFTDEALVHRAQVHLRSVGEDATAEHLQEFMNRRDTIENFCLDGTISLRTARRYMTELGYSYGYAKKGQYSDGHDREDVVKYRDQVYLPTLKGYEDRSWIFFGDGTIQLTGVPPGLRPTVIWYHDETVFFAHDRRRKLWQHRNASAKPYQKGDGGGYMVADYISAQFGWLRGENGESARRAIRPGKNKDGYFTGDSIEEQAVAACTIVTARWPAYDHIFVYDNATTHHKRGAGALSAIAMPRYISGTRGAEEDEEEGEDGGAKQKKKKPKKLRKPKPPAPVEDGKKKRKPRKPPKDPKDANFLAKVNERNPDGTVKYDEHGNISKVEIQMTGATFADGTPQDLYFPPDATKHAGKFKGMALILEERRERGDLGDIISKEALGTKLAQCKQFKCMPTADGSPSTCCLRRMLYEQPDFAGVQCCLEAACAPFGVSILFLPRFHPELNPIEMVWGFAKRIYRENPESSKDEVMEKNALAALEAVPLTTIRRFVIRAMRYADAYRNGLNGAEIAWATRKYKGHRILPPEFRAALEEEYKEAQKKNRTELKVGKVVPLSSIAVFEQ
ncbi:hypothetical protein MKEN_00120200 [Mycena kentingensis (nom. inval.)]|nr:hypothetical protein MKEN_00120200 [Mycena kentingensis (nom. inval.)]